MSQDVRGDIYPVFSVSWGDPGKYRPTTPPTNITPESQDPSAEVARSDHHSDLIQHSQRRMTQKLYVCIMSVVRDSFVEYREHV